ncbi:MAG: hypothetical protein A2Y33_07140 [Spirochaetes bacterium GWF1_51_8]|nr:MAG: hypothetical protein A2Y33_07140 [Spirochaetes bacterium GWF1_51_8]
MLLNDILKNIEISGAIPVGIEIANIENDSRKVDPGTLFIAASGYVDDAHVFIPDAYLRGCRYFLIDAARYDEFGVSYPEGVFLPARDIRHALAFAAKNFFGDPTSKMKLVGITGTNGKTTTAFTVYSSLMKLGHQTGLVGTIEYRIGGSVVPATNTTPDILALNRLFAVMAAAGVEYTVMEVSSHSLALGRVLGLEFDIMAFTNLTQDHLDFHGSMDAYLDAKLKIFDMLEISAKTGKAAIINRDMPVFDKIQSYAGTRKGFIFKTLSLHDSSADYHSEVKELTPRFTRYLMNGDPFEIGMIGDPNVYNFTLASAILIELGFAPVVFKPLLKDIHTRGRMERVHTSGDFDVFIDYAHSPDGLINLLQTMRKVVPSGGRVITLFGAGGDRDRTKRPLMGKAASEYSDIVIVTSDNPRTEDPDMIIRDILPGVEGRAKEYTVEPDRLTAIRKAIDLARPKDVIVVAGKGHEDYQIVGKIKHHFSDREEVETYLKDKGLS